MSFDNDGPDSSIDVYNFYQMGYPQAKAETEHLVSSIRAKVFRFGRRNFTGQKKLIFLYLP